MDTKIISKGSVEAHEGKVYIEELSGKQRLTIKQSFNNGTGNIAEENSNAHLIAEAFNVAAATGHSPQQLADANAVLREALENLMASMGGGNKKCGHDFHCGCPWDLARVALASPLQAIGNDKTK